MTKHFAITFPVVWLTAEDVWPEGDGPENPTDEDVAKELSKAGRWELMNEWGLMPTEAQVGAVTVSI